MIRIVKEFNFEAAHQLTGHDGACANLHGHSYRLRVGLIGEPSKKPGPKEGFLLDFGDLKRIVQETILDDWDHSFLAKGDEVILPALENAGAKIVRLGFRATAENMSEYILRRLVQRGLPVDFVRLYETAASYAQANAAELSDRPMAAPADGPELDESAVLPVSELFGPTVQGEGTLIGQKSLFLRLYGCDGHCVWCDSKYAWDGAERPECLTVREIVDRIEALGAPAGCRHLTLTGGNPCVHEGAAVESLLVLVRQAGYSIAVETQGTRAPDWIDRVDAVTVSPKPPSSKNETSLETLRPFVEKLAAGGVPFSMKVVVFDDADYAYMKRLYAEYPGPEISWFVQPGNPGGKADLADAVGRYEKLCQKVLADPALAWVRVLPQLHTWVWGNRRKV